jgi:hypothetical protein
MSLLKRLLRSAVIAPFLVATANAVILDWYTVSWTPGSLTGSGGPSGVTDPTYRHVGINGISFTPVAEINPAWSAFGSCLIAAALILRHSAKVRK